MKGEFGHQAAERAQHLDLGLGRVVERRFDALRPSQEQFSRGRALCLLRVRLAEGARKKHVGQEGLHCGGARSLQLSLTRLFRGERCLPPRNLRAAERVPRRLPLRR